MLATRVVEYEVLTAAKLVDLKRLVRQHIAAGWQPQGGIHAGEYGGGKEWAQAIVKYAQ